MLFCIAKLKKILRYRTTFSIEKYKILTYLRYFSEFFRLGSVRLFVFKITGRHIEPSPWVRSLSLLAGGRRL
jgi:hypothetical protein